MPHCRRRRSRMQRRSLNSARMRCPAPNWTVPNSPALPTALRPSEAHSPGPNSPSQSKSLRRPEGSSSNGTEYTAAPYTAGTRASPGIPPCRLPSRTRPPSRRRKECRTSRSRWCWRTSAGSENRSRGIRPASMPHCRRRTARMMQHSLRSQRTRCSAVRLPVLRHSPVPRWKRSPTKTMRSLMRLRSPARRAGMTMPVTRRIRTPHSNCCTCPWDLPGAARRASFPDPRTRRHPFGCTDRRRSPGRPPFRRGIATDCGSSRRRWRLSQPAHSRVAASRTGEDAMARRQSIAEGYGRQRPYKKQLILRCNIIRTFHCNLISLRSRRKNLNERCGSSTSSSPRPAL